MKVLALAVAMGLAASAASAEVAGRFRPATSDYVVLRVPALASRDPIAVLEARFAQERSESIATELAALYLERGRTRRELRHFARAEALVRPWVAGADARAATLRVQADILQNKHDFGGALALLDRALERDPRDAGAQLMRASVKMVQGKAPEARADCAAVLAAGESAVGSICLAQVLGATGGLERGQALLLELVARERGSSGTRTGASGSGAPGGGIVSTAASGAAGARPLQREVRGWALGLLADFADRAGDTAASESYLRAALEATPESEALRCALSDLLIARGAFKEAVDQADLPNPSVGLLARKAHAQVLMRSPGITETRAHIEAWLTLARRRADPPHLREEALIALNVDRDMHRALKLARENFAVQRETIDVRLLMSAARASRDTSALREVTDWLRETGFEDRALAEASL